MPSLRLLPFATAALVAATAAEATPVRLPGLPGLPIIGPAIPAPDCAAEPCPPATQTL